MSYLLGPRFEKVGQQRQASEFRRRQDIYQPHIDALRAEIARRKGIDKEKMTDTRYNKLTNSPEIQRLANYLKRAGRSVGSYTGKGAIGSI